MIVNVNIKSWIILSVIVLIIIFLTVSQRIGSTKIESVHRRGKNVDLQDKLLPKMKIENVNIEEHYKKIDGINTFYRVSVKRLSPGFKQERVL